MTSFGVSLCKPEFAERLKQMISQKDAYVVSATYCPYCNKAKQLLDHYKLSYDELMLDSINPHDSIEFSNCIFGNGVRFVPYIFMKGKSIGGYGELYGMH